MIDFIANARRKLTYGKGEKELKIVLRQLRRRQNKLYDRLVSGKCGYRSPAYYVEWKAIFARMEEVLERIKIINGEKEMEMERFPIQRFLDAQAKDYETALEELHSGRKRSHWMWYVFPQLRFLGQSENAYYYGIADEREAKEYCANEILHRRYIECCKALMGIEESSPYLVMGTIDSLKLRSSLSLFYMVDKENRALYTQLIEKFYQGKWDRSTIEYLANRRMIEMQVDDVSFQKIREKKKTVEIRLGDEKTLELQEGNRIRFIHKQDADKQFLTKIRYVNLFHTFEALFETENPLDCGFETDVIEDAVTSLYERYPLEEIQKCGVVAIRMQILDA